MENKQERKPRVFISHCQAPQTVFQLLGDSCELVVCPVLPVPKREDVLQYCRDVDAIFWTTQVRLDKEVMDAAGPSLRVIVTMSVGYEHLDVAEARRRGIKLGYVPGINTSTVADIGVALVLLVARRISEGLDATHNNQWLEYRPQWLMGKDLKNSTVGIVGLGNIGQAIAKRLLPFEIGRLLYCGHNKKSEGEALGAEFVRFEDLLQWSDFVIVSCPLADDTRRLFNRETFALMKSNAIFINISRGGIVDHEALEQALRSGQIWGAGLDVTSPEPLPSSHPLLQLRNCVVTPHLGGMTERTQAAMGERTALNILAGLRDEPMPSPIPQ